MLTWKLSQTLKIKLKIFSKSNWKEGIVGLTNIFEGMKDDSWACCFVLLYPLMLFISMQRSQTVEDVDTSEAGGQKSKNVRSDIGPEIFCRRLFCTFWMPDFLSSSYCRRMDSDCWFVSDISSGNFWHYLIFFLVPTCKSEQMHYHWKRFFRKAATCMTFVMFGPLRAKVGCIFSTDQSTNPGPFNTEIQKLSVFIPSRRFKDDFKCKHPKSEVC